MVDEQHAVQMVDLVLERGGEQAVEIAFMGRALLVEPARAAGGGAFDLGILLGDRKAAFAVEIGFLADRNQFGVDIDERGADGLGLFALPHRFLQIDHDNALLDRDLRRGEADAACVVHRVEHVGDDLPHRIIDRFDGLGDGAEAGVWDFEDF